MIKIRNMLYNMRSYLDVQLLKQTSISCLMVIIVANGIMYCVNIVSRIPVQTELLADTLVIDEDMDEDTLLTELQININSAPKSRLMQLPNIGGKKAEAIIAYREEQPFEDIDDLKQVKGIGDATFEKLKDLITV